MSRNPYEERGRAEKVSRLVEVIEKLDQPPSADDVAEWASGTWASLTATANAFFNAHMKPPSAASRALVIEELRRRERSRCLCFVPPAGPGVPHESGCPLSNVRSLADARTRRAAS